MTRMSVFSSPLLLGFDHIERVLDRVNKSSGEGYPPYNIEQTGEHTLRITLAVAGFAQWIANAAISVSFPSLAVSPGLVVTYTGYALFAAISFFFVRAMVHETKGRELEDMVG